jgi:hypothetical protein
MSMAGNTRRSASLRFNDRAMLGPWVNKPWLNAVWSVIIGVLVMLSLILAATTLFPELDVRPLTLTHSASGESVKASLVDGTKSRDADLARVPGHRAAAGRGQSHPTRHRTLDTFLPHQW